MEITEVTPRIQSGPGRVLAFVEIVLDGVFVVQDIKIVSAPDGRKILAMPDRRLGDRCPCCKVKNPYTNRHCGQCGAAIDPYRAPSGHDGRPQLFADVAFPIDDAFRSKLETRVFASYRLALEFDNPEKRYCCMCDEPWDISDVVNLRGVHLVGEADDLELCCAGDCVAEWHAEEAVV